MDDFITVILIIIGVISFLSQFIPKDKKGKERPEAEPEHEYAYAYEYEDASSPSDGDMREAHTDEYSLSDLDLISDAASEKPAAAPPVKTQHKQTGASESNKGDPAGIAPGQSRRAPLSITAAKRSTLRQAIIWSEIIGPPVALRDSSGSRR